MKTAKIKKNNPQSFIDDLRRAKGVMVRAEKTDAYFFITKKSLEIEAETKRIDYFKSNDLNHSDEFVMIVA